MDNLRKRQLSLILLKLDLEDEELFQDTFNVPKRNLIDNLYLKLKEEKIIEEFGNTCTYEHWQPLANAANCKALEYIMSYPQEHYWNRFLYEVCWEKHNDRT